MKNVQVFSLNGDTSYVIPQLYGKCNWPFEMHDSPDGRDIDK